MLWTGQTTQKGYASVLHLHLSLYSSYSWVSSGWVWEELSGSGLPELVKLWIAAINQSIAWPLWVACPVHCAVSHAVFPSMYFKLLYALQQLNAKWMLNVQERLRKSQSILFQIQTNISCITPQAASRMFAQSMKTLSQLRNYGIGELNLIHYTKQYAWPWNEMHLMDWTFRTFWLKLQKTQTDMSDSCELNKITLTKHFSNSLLSNSMYNT